MGADRGGSEHARHRVIRSSPQRRQVAHEAAPQVAQPDDLLVVEFPAVPRVRAANVEKAFFIFLLPQLLHEWLCRRPGISRNSVVLLHRWQTYS